MLWGGIGMHTIRDMGTGELRLLQLGTRDMGTGELRLLRLGTRDMGTMDGY